MVKFTKGRVALAAAATVAAVVTPAAWAAQISIGPSGTFSTDFNSLPATTGSGTGVGAITPAPLATTTGAQADIPGGSGFVATRVAGTTGNPPVATSTALPFLVDDGTQNSGGIRSFGVVNNADRALGTLASGSNTPAFGAEFVNNTGSIITGFNLAFSAEQFRSASSTTATAGVPNNVVFAFGTSGSVGTATSGGFLTDADLIADPLGDLVSTTSGTTSATVTNNPPISTPRLVSVAGLSVAPGESIFIRFTDFNDPANDAGIGIDDLSFSAVTVPEPASLGLIGAAGLLALRRRRK